MRLFIRRLQYDWGSWLAVAFIALLPFSRLSEIPLSIFALSLAFLARSAAHRARIRSAARFVLPLFLCFWIPMVLSSLDSVVPQKSWMQSAAALRFLAAALALSVLTMGCDRTISERESENVKPDGTVEKKEKRVTESPDGTIKKEEKKSTERP